LIINDLGKSSRFLERLAKIHTVTTVDHDKLLLLALEESPALVPSFQRLTPKYKSLLLEGLRSEFNLGQFLQAECVPASFANLLQIDGEALNLLLLHALCDIGGAAGHLVSDGSATITAAFASSFADALAAIREGVAPETSVQLYDRFLARRAVKLGTSLTTPTERAITRVCCHLRLDNQAQADQVRQVFHGLPSITQKILSENLNRTGTEGEVATVVYYAPAILTNQCAAYRRLGESDFFIRGVQEGLNALARIYHCAEPLRHRTPSKVGVKLVLATEAAEVAKNAGKLSDVSLTLEEWGEDAVVRTTEGAALNGKEFPQLPSLAELPGKRILTIGIGGGSDSLQAAQLGSLLNLNGKECAAVVSIRTAMSASQGPNGVVGEVRTVSHHGGEIAPGVFRITPNSTGSGRFLENIPAAETKMFLVLDRGDGGLTKQLQAVADEVGGIDTIIAVDTGGDALVPVAADSTSLVDTTPDQDRRVLEALVTLQIRTVTAVIACGVDSPPTADTILRRAGARYYSPTQDDATQVQETYRRWQVDGTSKLRYGKTPYAWQAALRGGMGFQCLPLPEQVVFSTENPWNPFVFINGERSTNFEGAMRGIFFTSLGDHLRAIRSPVGTVNPQSLSSR
jgi:hypothetical protein